MIRPKTDGRTLSGPAAYWLALALLLLRLVDAHLLIGLSAAVLASPALLAITRQTTTCSLTARSILHGYASKRIYREVSTLQPGVLRLLAVRISLQKIRACISQKHPHPTSIRVKEHAGQSSGLRARTRPCQGRRLSQDPQPREQAATAPIPPVLHLV